MTFLFAFSLVLAICAGIGIWGAFGYVMIEDPDISTFAKLCVLIAPVILCAFFSGLAAQANSVLP